MAKYISLLRGINVSGQKIIKMQDLKSLYLSLGFDDVQTYIQSGNVIFDSHVDDEAKLAAQIKAGIQKQYGFDVKVILRTPGELQSVISRNPFSRQAAVDVSKLYVTFLLSKPSAVDVKKLGQFDSDNDEFDVLGSL